jgi:hypothetical protein
MMSAEVVAKSLKMPRKISGGWQACCPAHDDKTPSLSIADGESGRLLVNCHAGCSQDSVIDGLKRMDVWPQSDGNSVEVTKQRISATYDYVDQNGSLQYQVVRYAPKDFRQRRPNGNGGWNWSLKGVERLPYRLTDLSASTTKEVFIVEGEKDADALAAFGLVATCNAGGAKNWSIALSRHFVGKTVYVIPDNDEPGRRHAKTVAASLSGKASSVRVVDLTSDTPDLPEKGDVSDWLDLGGNPSDLMRISQSAPEWRPDETGNEPELLEDNTLPTAVPFVLGDPTKIPPREFIYGGHYVRKFVTATAGIGGAGKSTIIVVEALSIATGRNLLGQQVIESCPVWYANLEDPEDEICRRLTAATMKYGISSEQLENRLYVTSGRSSSFVIAEESHDGVKIVTPVVAALKAEIRKKNIGLLIIDPFVKAHRVSENANERIDIVISTFAEIAEETGVCIELVPHLRKGIGERGSDDIRGASSFVGAVRSTRIVNVMSNDEAKSSGIKDERRRYLRVDDGKRNMTPPGDKMIWRKLEGVDLGNATETRPSDNVGVAVAWKWPDPFDGVNIHHLEKVQKQIANGSYRENVQAADWVGKVVAEILNLDLEMPENKTKVKGILKTWLTSGVLIKVEKEGEDRKKRPYIEVGEWAK